ncbi:polynucleotide 3'-phosphatase /polynucleotide 5'-hydroxyl-kinase /polynucleotide 2',3'-cyclic phosphate phosphodiesterase [Micromonospora pattaloongensis]|uniref:Polynucleotide 3'-phosphatase /polynucleotide 5'-hydroxyl-kinase /polynucleotide 2',3'-cyclic phosphate phosphodiesterase n=1 Tax=Micromonospora pattaloongensis TaxID=405436 RepID=A0A1H3JQV8_9ACTN|nr:polynucleotide kinase-phosphatase [Micromonospora pattaloongensis]SDY42297.1 polynucleotide 3'-phosphatase /polynucleotide 5'-hydroxyl-kinase /polynucleotide 2',3'-cyclic phosphate phosphodiesterase [Micromonospora pattaloongensis]
MNLDIPELSLIALVGISGSGKSTFARRYFKPTEVLSSDAFRAMVADDENDQSASKDAFEALHHVAGIRLRAGRRVVVDATNVQQHARAELVKLAREHDVLPVAIVLDTPEPIAWERTQARQDRTFGRQVLRSQQQNLRRSLRNLGREGFRKVHVVTDPGDVTITYERAWNDKREITGPFDIIGDVHGCRSELETLLTKLGWAIERDEAGRPVNATHPEGRLAVFVGDLVDRGPDSPGVLRLVMGMTAAGTALCVPGNHEQKLLRKLRGRKVSVTHGLAETLSQLEAETPEFIESAATWIDGLVSHLRLDGGRLVVAHAGLKEEFHGRASGRVRAFCLYGETTGETDEYGLPVRYPWANDYRGSAMVVYGHVPTPKPEWVNNTICLDTGCVFGGHLTALRYPEKDLVSVPAERMHYEPVKPLVPATPARDDATLNLADVTGRRHIRTDYGALTVDAENAAAALEVMSRFAVDPRYLLWLPPTMSPPSTSTLEGYLEYPTEAFADYRAVGVERVVCEEKHMGSRAVVLVCRDAASAAGRFGVDDGSSGTVYTRTGRPFFTDAELTEALLARVRAAADPLFDELATDWLLLDCELLPWSAKAGALIKGQYAAVGAAARAALPTALSALDAGIGRGLDLSELRARTAARAANAGAFTEAYRRYCWPIDGLDGIQLAPFMILASEGASHTARDHGWHLALCDRLVAADPDLLRRTDRRIVDLGDETAIKEATEWWLELTGAGGEGMVIKPYNGLQHRAKGKPVQPGIKCRGREYLRIIYGPDYTEPRHLERLRDRGLQRKRGLALREHGLGLAALDAVAAGEPLWRVHELVFAVLALESEPTDPRL